MTRIRLVEDSDADGLAEIYRPSIEGSAISFEIEPPDAEEMRRRIAHTMPSYPWLVCDLGREVAGYAYAATHNVRAAYQWSVNVSVYIGGRYRQCGVGRGLYTSLFAILVAQGYVNAYAGITLPNAGSVALHESMGFTKIGVYARVGYKLGAWHDVGWWQLALTAHEPSPAPPIDVTKVRTRADWPELLAGGESRIRATID